MKIVFVVKYYDNYRSGFYSKIANLQELSYDELVHRYINDYFSFYSSLVSIFKNEGHEAHLVIPNCPVIREKWRRKIGLDTTLDDKQFIRSVIDTIQPGVLFLNSNFEYYGAFAHELRRKVKAFYCWISCPYDKGLELSAFDGIFTLFPPHYAAFKSAGLPAHLVTAGFDPAILKRANVKTDAVDFSFVGGIGGFHKKREACLKKICAATPLKLWGYGYSSSNLLKKIVKDIRSGFAWNKHYQGQAWGMEMFEILGSSKITLNIHGDIADGHSVNMRLFEATGMGSLLLTDHSDDIVQLFTPGVEIITFKTAAEAIEKYRYYSNHDEERRKIAKAGQQKTLTLYNYERIAGIFMYEFKQLTEK